MTNKCQSIIPKVFIKELNISLRGIKIKWKHKSLNLNSSKYLRLRSTPRTLFKKNTFPSYCQKKLIRNSAKNTKGKHQFHSHRKKMTLTNDNRAVTNQTKYNDALLVLVEDIVQKKSSSIKFKI